MANGSKLMTPIVQIGQGFGSTAGESQLKAEQNSRIEIATTLRMGLGSLVDVSNGGGIDIGAPAQPAASGQIAVGADGRLSLTPYSKFSQAQEEGNLPVINGSVQIQSGGTATGWGIINGNVVNYGVTHVGDDPGIITVNGNYTQGATGALQIEVGPTSYSQLIVSGTAALNGALQFEPVQGGALQLGQTYTVVTAAGGITGEFSSIASGSPFISLSGGVVGGAFELTPQHAPNSFALAAETGNQLSVARGLDAAASAPLALSSCGAAILNALGNTSLAGAQAAFDQLSGAGLAGAQNAAFQSNALFLSTMSDQARYWLEGGADAIGVTLGAPTGALGCAGEGGLRIS